MPLKLGVFPYESAVDPANLCVHQLWLIAVNICVNGILSGAFNNVQSHLPVCKVLPYCQYMPGEPLPCLVQSLVHLEGGGG